MKNKKTIVFVASLKEYRYSNFAVRRLKNNSIETIPLGYRAGEIDGVEVLTDFSFYEGIDTITLYINPRRQVEHYDYILSLKPKRIIFNPGTENIELQKLARNQGIESLEACTLVLLNLGRY